MRCIFCGEEKEESIEHIIPEALGNRRLVTKRVCIECNNKFGANVDNYLTDHILIRIIRKSLGVTGKDDKEVKLFPGHLKGSDGKDYVFENDKPQLRPTAIMDNNVLRVEAQSIDEALKFAKKKLERSGIPEEKVEQFLSNIQRVPQEGNSESPVFKLPADIDKSRFLLAAIKIAYEYSCEELGDKYYDDKIAVILREQLCNAIQSKKNMISDNIGYEVIKKYSHIMDEMTLDIKTNIEPLIKTMSPPVRHILILSPDMDNNLICSVILFYSDITTFTVLVSDDAIQYNMAGKISVAVVLEDNSIYRIGKDGELSIL